tara:strand:- start:580 stop:1227 length:648 start_codon:yes stop_codon:yes gene_type:complete
MSTLTVGTIAEKVTDAGVAVDGVTLKDGGATFTSAVGVTGNTTITSGNLVIGTSGNGIDFSATSDASGMTSELLDSYEEGSFTPVVADASSGGNTASGTFVGQYVKVGKLVQIYCNLGNINTSGMTSGNALVIRGLPFTSSFSDSGNQSNMFGIGVVLTDRITFENYVTSFIQHGNAHFFLRDNDVNIADSSIKVSDVNVSGGSDLMITLSYPSA